MSVSLRLDNVVIAYPHFFEKHTPPGSNQSKYSVESILDPEKNAAAIAAAEEAFKKAAVEAGKGDKIQFLTSPVRSGDEINADQQRKGKDPRAEIAGKRIIRAGDSNYAPQVVDRNKQPIGESQRSMIFGGCVCNVFVDFYWSSNSLNPGVFVGLKGVQLVDNVNVEKFGGGAPSADAMFEVVDGPAPLVGEGAAEPGWM